MSRLIAFGCSLTQGQALEENISYSKLSWPYKLAEIMQLDCVNAGQNGASAKKIWFNILNFEFQADDIVVILWTHMDRWCIITRDTDTTHDSKTEWDIYPDIKQDYRQNTGQTLININPNFSEEDTLMYLWYENFHDEYDMDLQYYLHVAHANNWLKDRVKNIYNLKASELNRQAFFNEVDFLKTNINYIRRQHPKALDNHHPGPLAMEKFAEYVYQEIQNKNYLH